MSLGQDIVVEDGFEVGDLEWTGKGLWFHSPTVVIVSSECDFYKNVYLQVSIRNILRELKMGIKVFILLLLVSKDSSSVA